MEENKILNKFNINYSIILKRIFSCILAWRFYLSMKQDFNKSFWLKIFWLIYQSEKILFLIHLEIFRMFTKVPLRFFAKKKTTPATQAAVAK